MRLCLYALRFVFRATETVRFPPGQAANTLRGALGTIVSRASHSPDSAYHRIFAPQAPTANPGPSGLHDPPRPFVFRAAHLDGRTLPAGSPFHFDLNFFDLRHPGSISQLTAAFGQAAGLGLGPGRGRARLAGVERRHVALSLEAPAHPIGRVTVVFRTPTELKSDAGLAGRPEFPILAARIRDRLSILGGLYGEGSLPIDFRAFGERARLVAMTRCRLEHHEIMRRSSRTGQSHSLGGFTGEAQYEGDLTEFLPYLRAAAWTGVGRQTVWGKGEIAVR